MRSFLALMVTIASAACGDDGNNNGIPDAPVFDSAVDTPTVGLVKLTITSGTTPQPDVKVHFLNADNTVVLSTTTDANGVASATMEAGGSVTAIDPFPIILPTGIAGPTELKTFMRVKPGDELVLHETGQFVSNPITVTLVLSREPTDTAVRYEVETKCGRFQDVTGGAGSGGSGNPGGSFLLDGCGAMTDFLVVAFDGANQPVNTIFKQNVAIADMGVIDFSAEAYTAPDTVSWKYEDVPGSVGSFSTFSFLIDNSAVIYENDVFGTVTGGTGMVVGEKRPQAAVSQVVYTNFSGPNFSSYDVLEWGPPVADYDFKMASTLLPPEYTAAPTWDFGINGVRWMNDGLGTAPTFVRSFVSFSRNAGATTWNWEIIDNGAAASIPFPVLPAPDDGFKPLATDEFQSIETLTSGVSPGGYDGIRENLLAFDRFNTPLDLAVGATGRVTFEELSFGKVSGKRHPRSPFARPSKQPLRVHR